MSHIKDSHLQYLFKRYNHVGFDGRLPRISLLRFAKLDEGLLGCYYKRRPLVRVGLPGPCIFINERLRSAYAWTCYTLLHEMLHHYGLDHGRQFEERFLCTAKKVLTVTPELAAIPEVRDFVALGATSQMRLT